MEEDHVTLIPIGTYGKLTPDPITVANMETGLAEIRKVDEVTLLLFPDATSLNLDSDFFSINQSALTPMQ